jgi:predicted RNase H-like HicB family nuclease
MLKATLAILVLISLTLSSLTGCHSMGKATGKTADEVEEGADEFKEGYREGKRKN